MDPSRQKSLAPDDQGPTSRRRSLLRAPRLLLVEDDDPLRTTLTRTLRHRFEVTAFADGVSAAKQLEVERFDVVLCDVLLRGMTGIDLLRIVRSHDLDVPVILMTGLPDVDGAIEAMDLGALTYIKKPFDPHVLDAALDRAAKLAALARAKREAIEAGLGGNPTSNERAALEQSFERALDSLWIAFQPIVDGKTKRTIGFEALMRSNEPTMPSPSAVLDAAERLDRVHDLGRRIRARVAHAFTNAVAPEDDDETLVFVNLHAADLFDADLFDARAPLSKLAHRVVLELTERATITDITDARHRTAELRRRGFKIAIDDLGAGYAGLSSFATFEPEIVKLDMSLVRGVEGSPVKRKIVGRLASLCHELEMSVVAEGIETPAELDAMLDLGCEYVQGFLLGRPDGTRRHSRYPF